MIKEEQRCDEQNFEHQEEREYEELQERCKWEEGHKSEEVDESEEERNEVQKKEGQWSEEQNLLFAIFMDFHNSIFQTGSKRKGFQIFRHMSKYLGSRTPRQCRSHFQKLLLRHKTIQKIIKSIRSLLPEKVYEKRYKEVSKTLTPISVYKNTQSPTQEVGIQVQPEHPYYFHPQMGIIDNPPVVQPYPWPQNSQHHH